MRYWISISVIFVSFSISAQKEGKLNDSKVYKCRTMDTYDDKYVLEYGEEVRLIGVRVYDSETEATVAEYSYPYDLINKGDHKGVINQYKKDLRDIAKACPDPAPSLSERYTDPYYYKANDFEEVEDIKVYNRSIIEDYNGYAITYYETVDSVLDQPVMISHLCAVLDDSEYYCRENARLLIEDYDDQMTVWSDAIKSKIDIKVTADTTQYDIVDLLSKRYSIENKRKRTDIEKHKIKESASCDAYSKGDIIVSKARMIIIPCKDGTLDDIEVRTAKRDIRTDKKWILTGDKVKAKVLKDTYLRIKIKKDESNE